MRRHLYAVDGWGLGELYVSGRVVVAHELPSAPGERGRRRETGAHLPDAGMHLPIEAHVPIEAHFPKGTPVFPEITLAEKCARRRDDFVSTSPTRAAPAEDTSGSREGSSTFPEAALVDGIVARVRRQLAGYETSYGEVPLDLSWCTPFQAALARALRAVPWGEVVTYGELAALAGRREAPRAAGAFCARNRFPLLLPCHRVVAAAGIGGYGSAGVALKRRLLELEGVEL